MQKLKDPNKMKKAELLEYALHLESMISELDHQNQCLEEALVKAQNGHDIGSSLWKLTIGNRKKVHHVINTQPLVKPTEELVFSEHRFEFLYKG